MTTQRMKRPRLRRHVAASAADAAPANPYPNVARRVDSTLGATVATLHPGDYYVATQGELIMTVLGSCVSACARDTGLKIGGMNHFMLPVDQSIGNSAWSSAANAATRFGNVAMERLINDILKLGGRRERLEFKLVGGGKILENMTDVGERNVRFILDYMHAEGFKVVGADLGNVHPRKVLYDPATGNAKVKHLPRTTSTELATAEIGYLRRIDAEPVGGEVELF